MVGRFGGGLIGSSSAFAGTALGGKLGMAGGPIGAGIGAILGTVLGSLLGGLFKPGRIAMDKKAIRKFHKKYNTGLPVPSRSEVRHGWRDASAEYDEIEPSLGALSLSYADLDDKIEHVQGTMKRFGNSFQVGLQQVNASMGLAEEKVLSPFGKNEI